MGFFRWVKLVTEASPWSQTGLLPKNAVAVQTQGKRLPTPNDSSGFGVALDLTGTQLMGVDFWSKAPIFPPSLESLGSHSSWAAWKKHSQRRQSSSLALSIPQHHIPWATQETPEATKLTQQSQGSFHLLRYPG